MGLGLSPFVVAGARDQMRADEQMGWAREDQQFRRGQREREVKRAGVADELFNDQMTDYRDERAFTRGMRDTTTRNAGASRFDFTTALEEFARRNGRVELAEKFRADRESGHIDVMKRVVTAASSGADATRIAGILNEGRPAAERIDPAALQLQTDANGRTTGLVMRGPQGRPVPVDLNHWAMMTGLARPQNVNIRDNVMTIANGDGSQSLVTFDNGRLVIKKNPNHVPDQERGPGRGAGAAGTGGSGGAGGSSGGSGNIVAFESAVRDAIKDFPQFVERDPGSGQMRGVNPAGQAVIQVAASLAMGSRQGRVSNGRATATGPAALESPTAALQVAMNPTGQWKDVETTVNGRSVRATAWVINDPASGGEVAYFPNNPVYRDVPRAEEALRWMQQSSNFGRLVEEVRQMERTPDLAQRLDQELGRPGAGEALLAYITQTMQVEEAPQAMPAGAGPAVSASARPPAATSGAVGRAIARTVGGFLDNGPQAFDRSGRPLPGTAVPAPPGGESALAFGPSTNPRFQGGPQGSAPSAPRDWRANAQRAPGMVEPGNIDLQNRPRVNNANGSVSTVKSVGVNLDGREVLLPTIDDSGREMSVDEAVEQYRRTGKHLGIFRDSQSATAYAQSLSNQQGQRVSRGIPQP